MVLLLPLESSAIDFMDEGVGMSKSPFLSSIESYMRVRNYSKRTISAYLYWIKSFILFCNKQHPRDLGGEDVEQH